MRPFEVNSYIGRTQDIGLIKQNQDSKPLMQQHTIAQNFEKHVDDRMEQVNHKENSEFENIAGNASLLRNNSSIVRNCSFHHIMYPAVLLGGDLDNESVTGRNLLVEGCEFVDCAWVARNGAKAPVAAGIHKYKDFTIPYIYDMKILNNRFVDSNTAIHLIKVDGVEIKGNTFENCNEKVKLDKCLNVDSDVE